MNVTPNPAATICAYAAQSDPQRAAARAVADPKETLVAAMNAYLAATNEDGETRVVTDFIVTMAFINLDRRGGTTGIVHECEGAVHSLLGLTKIQDMWMVDHYAERELENDEDPEAKGY